MRNTIDNSRLLLLSNSGYIVVYMIAYPIHCKCDVHFKSYN
jgi:hypothetical protein